MGGVGAWMDIALGRVAKSKNTLQARQIAKYR